MKNRFATPLDPRWSHGPAPEAPPPKPADEARPAPVPAPLPPPADAAALREHRLERLIERLPPRPRAAARWLRKPSARWVRIPAGVLFVFGGLLFILPFLGLWMLPLGLLLLAEDVAPLKRVSARLLEAIERHRPHWLAPAHVLAKYDPS